MLLVCYTIILLIFSIPQLALDSGQAKNVELVKYLKFFELWNLIL